MDYVKRSKHQRNIDRMMFLAKQELPTVPTTPSEKVRVLRAKIVGEEYLEMNDGLGVTMHVTIPAHELLALIKKDSVMVAVPVRKDNVLFVATHEPNLKEIVDGVADVSVTAIGTLSACGVNDCSVLQTVDENNLAKFGPGGYEREDGKWMKPPNHPAPDIEGVLEAQRQAVSVYEQTHVRMLGVTLDVSSH